MEEGYMTKKDFEVVAKICGAYEHAFNRQTDEAYNNAWQTALKLLKQTNQNFDEDRFLLAMQQAEDALIEAEE